MDVSIVIRNRNEREHLRRVLEALRHQAIQPEVVLVDNDSTDGSLEAALEFDATVVPISRQDFSYGRALNYGFRAAHGEIVVCLSAHALPLGSRFLDQLLIPFSDDRIAAVRGNNVAYMDQCSDWTRRQELTWPVTWEEMWRFAFANTCCAIRRAVWEVLPFNETLEGAEDSLWCFQAVKEGHAIVVGDSYYWYMRREPFWQWIRRFSLTATAQYRISGSCSTRLPFSRFADEALVRIPKHAVRSLLDVTLRFVALKAVPARAKRASVQGSLR